MANWYHITFRSRIGADMEYIVHGRSVGHARIAAHRFGRGRGVAFSKGEHTILVKDARSNDAGRLLDEVENVKFYTRKD